MKLNDLPPTGNWTLARRAERMNPSVIREILKVTEKPGIISLAGGLPSPKTFPVSAFAAASAAVLANDGPAALQYAASEGFAPLREAIAAFLPWDVDADQVLITTGSQQALDLIAKVLIDTDSRVLVETPTYLGALQAFAPMEPQVVAVDSDDEGVLIDELIAKVGTGANKARFLYVLPNFQNPTGRTMSDARRSALVHAAAALNLPLVEDNPYGDLWFDNPPRPRSRPAIPTVAFIWARSPRCWHRACAWATSWRPRPCTPSCSRPSRPLTCIRPATTSGW